MLISGELKYSTGGYIWMKRKNFATQSFPNKSEGKHFAFTSSIRTCSCENRADLHLKTHVPRSLPRSTLNKMHCAQQLVVCIIFYKKERTPRKWYHCQQVKKNLTQKFTVSTSASTCSYRHCRALAFNRRCYGQRGHRAPPVTVTAQTSSASAQMLAQRARGRRVVAHV